MMAVARGRTASTVGAVVFGTALALGGCGRGPSTVRLDEHQIVVTNRTSERWTDVEIWLNDHYRVTARELLPGGQLVVPLDAFVAGFGQRFDRRRQAPFGIEVTARAAAGREIRIEWGKGRRR